MWKNFKVYTETSDVLNSESEEKTEASYLGKEELSASQGEKKAEKKSWWFHCMNFHSLNTFIFTSGQMGVLGLVC